MTELLHAWGGGDLVARDELVVVVHQAYLRLIDQRHPDWQNRAHFFALASEMMRRILVDHARRRQMTRRSGGWARVTLDEAVAQRDPRDVDLLDLDAALSELASLDPRKSRVVELRFFGGLSLDDSAQALGLSRATVEREWQFARQWLYRRITRRPADHDA